MPLNLHEQPVSGHLLEDQPEVILTAANANTSYLLNLPHTSLAGNAFFVKDLSGQGTL